jgi:hypothetical protein
MGYKNLWAQGKEIQFLWKTYNDNIQCSHPLQTGSLHLRWLSQLLVMNVEMTPSLRVAHK